VSIFLPQEDADKYRDRPRSTPSVEPSLFERPRGDAYDPYTGEPLNDEEQQVAQRPTYGQDMLPAPQPPPPPATNNPVLDQRLAGMAGGFGDRNIPQVGAGESLANIGRVAGVGAELAMSPYAEALGLPNNWVTQELARPVNYIPFGKGISVARAATEAVGGRLAQEVAQPLIQKLPEPIQPVADFGVNVLGQIATGGLYGRSGGSLGMSIKDVGENADEAVKAAAGSTTPPPASVSETLYGLTPAQPESPNRFIQALDNLKRATRVGVPTDEIATPIMQTRARVKTVADSLAARIGAVADEAQGVFPTDQYGRITSIPGSPTIQDIAADLTRYADDLTPRQMEAMNRLRAEVEPIGRAIKEQGVEFGVRADVKDGGFYLPRGNAAVEGWDEPLKVRSGSGKGKSGYRKTAEFDTQAKGIEAGYEYTPFAEAMQGYARQGATDTVDAWAANQFKATGLGEVGTGFRDKGVIGLPGMQGMSFPDEIANVANKALNAEKPISGKFASTVAVKNAIDAMARMAGSTLDASGLGLQGLLGLSLDPRAYGTAIKVSIKSIGNPRAVGAYLKEFDARAVAAGRPTSREFVKAGQRFGGSVTEFTGQGIPQRVERVIESSLPLTRKIVKGGLNPIRGANRQFGAFGDVLRNELSDTSFDIARAKGTDGWAQLPEIVTSANKMTGWTKRRLGGDLGEFVNYAPRWMEANLETLVDAGRGALPGANLGQQQSRNAVLRLVGVGTLLTFAANEALGQETDTRLTINGRDNPNFMRIRGGGYDISVFGFYDRLIHLMAKAATGDGEGVARSLMNAPSISTAWDLISGEDVVGRKTRDTIGQTASTIARRAVPMSSNEYAGAVQALAEGNKPKAAAAAAVGLTGLRGTELSVRERVQLNEYAQLPPEDQLRGIPAQSWRTLGESAPPQFKQIIGGYQNVYEWKQAVRKEYAEQLIQRGLSPSNADYFANLAVEKHPIAQAYTKVKNHYEAEWIRANPQLAEQVLQEDMREPDPRKKRLSPARNDRAVIQAGQ